MSKPDATKRDRGRRPSRRLWTTAWTLPDGTPAFFGMLAHSRARARADFDVYVKPNVTGIRNVKLVSWTLDKTPRT